MSRVRIGWGLLLSVALIAWGAIPAPARATSFEPPAIEDMLWGPEVIPLEGTIVVFTGPWDVPVPIPHLGPRFIVTDAEGTEVPGLSQQLTGTAATGDALVWQASAPLVPGQRYEVTLATTVGDASRSRVAAAEPAAGPTAPAITSALLSETPQTSDCLFCQEYSGDLPLCVPTRYEYVPGLVAEWREREGALDRRYVRYRWLALQPDGTYASVVSHEGTSGEDPSISRETAFFVAAEVQVGELCVVVEAWSLVDGTTALSAPSCVAWSELTRVPHEQPDAPACPEGWSEPGADEAEDDEASPTRGCMLAAAPRDTTGLALLLLAVASRRRRSSSARRCAQSDPSGRFKSTIVAPHPPPPAPPSR